MINEKIMQLKEAKLKAEQEARAVINDERKHGEKDEAVLKNLFDTTYRLVLEEELGADAVRRS